MTASDWGPDSPADDPDVGGKWLANEVTRVATYRRAADTDDLVPVSTVAQGATNPGDPDPSVIPSGNDGSGDLRAEVARALGNAGVSPFEIEGFRIEDVADRLHRAGLRLVSDDDATVDRVAAELADVGGYLWPEDGEEEAAAQAGLSRTIADVDHYRLLARAAVRALREAGQ